MVDNDNCRNCRPIYDSIVTVVYYKRSRALSVINNTRRPLGCGVTKKTAESRAWVFYLSGEFIQHISDSCLNENFSH